tara:strand:- start:15 stop:545 length:531 start_codon:yes stop_codon:yes gene_type:complete
MLLASNIGICDDNDVRAQKLPLINEDYQSDKKFNFKNDLNKKRKKGNKKRKKKGGKQARILKALNRLELEPEQKSEIQKLMMSDKEALKSNKEKSNKKNIMKDLEKAFFESDKVEEYSAVQKQLESILLDDIRRKFDLMNKLFTILTKEQRLKLMKMISGKRRVGQKNRTKMQRGR